MAATAAISYLATSAVELALPGFIREDRTLSHTHRNDCEEPSQCGGRGPRFPVRIKHLVGE